MDGSDVIVETNLQEEVEYRGKTLIRHARTRIVERQRAVSIDPPQLGDPWCPLTVRARLQRMAEVFRRIPHDPDTRPARERSCMPTPVREIFKDMPGEPMRTPASRADLQAAMEILDSLVGFSGTEDRLLIWGIAMKLGHRRIGRQLRCHHDTAARKVQAMLERLATDWNGRGWLPKAADIAAVRELIRRDFYGR